MSSTDNLYTEISNTIRGRIFQARPDQEMVFRETEVAKEFGISRTPVRQIFQTLAAERLLETRSGVGSFTPILEAESRHADFEAYAQITLGAARVCTLTSVPPETKMIAAGIAAQVGKAENHYLEFFSHVAVQTVAVLSPLIPHPILNDAFRAARWRVVRWRMDDCRHNPTDFWQRTERTLVRMANVAETDDPVLMLEVAAGTTMDLSKTLPKADG